MSCRRQLRGFDHGLSSADGQRLFELGNGGGVAQIQQPITCKGD